MTIIHGTFLKEHFTHMPDTLAAVSGVRKMGKATDKSRTTT
jgi:hypothetical protein